MPFEIWATSTATPPAFQPERLATGIADATIANESAAGHRAGDRAIYVVEYDASGYLPRSAPMPIDDEAPPYTAPPTMLASEPPSVATNATGVPEPGKVDTMGGAFDAIAAVRVAFDAVHDAIEQLLPPSRERSVAVTQLETAELWAVHAVSVGLAAQVTAADPRGGAA